MASPSTAESEGASGLALQALLERVRSAAARVQPWGNERKWIPHAPAAKSPPGASLRPGISVAV